MVTIRWRLDAADPIIQQHVVMGRTVLPFAAWLNRCFAAVTAVQSQAPRELTRVVLARPMVFTAGHPVAAQFIGRPEAGSGRFEVREESDQPDRQPPGVPFIEGLWRNATDEDWLRGHACTGAVLDQEAFYAAASEAGYAFGPHLRRIGRLRMDAGAWTADLTPQPADRAPSAARETTWDALLQSGAVMAAASDQACWIPFSIDRVRLPADYDDQSLVRLWGQWVGGANGSPGRVANICGFGIDDALPLFELRGVRYRLLEAPSTQPPAPTRPIAAPVLSDVGADSILTMLRSSSPDHRRPLLVRFIEDQLLEILQWDQSKRAQLAAGFAAVGVDSLSSLDLQYRLQTTLEFALPLGEAFDQPSAGELADALLDKHLKLDRH